MVSLLPSRPYLRTIPLTSAPRPDIPAILSMIRELAGHEKALSSVQASEASLRRTLTFASHPTPVSSTEHPTFINEDPPGYAKTLILRLPDTGEAAGMAMFFNNYSTWRSKPGVYLEDLFVREVYRGRGYGKMLIRALAQEVLRIDGARLEWSCLRWNSGSLAFYDSLGARRMEEWVGLRLEGEALTAVAEGRKRAVNVGVGINGTNGEVNGH